VADAHRLKVSQIYRVEGGWRAEGHDYLIPEHEVLPSQDEHVWLFYSILGDGSQSHAICLFLPQGAFEEGTGAGGTMLFQKSAVFAELECAMPQGGARGSLARF
jgi:hypothetical protein